MSKNIDEKNPLVAFTDFKWEMIFNEMQIESCESWINCDSLRGINLWVMIKGCFYFTVIWRLVWCKWKSFLGHWKSIFTSSWIRFPFSSHFFMHFLWDFLSLKIPNQNFLQSNQIKDKNSFIKGLEGSKIYYWNIIYIYA